MNIACIAGNRPHNGFMIYFEDIEPGQTQKFGSYAVTREEVLEFAQKYDPQPFHLDDEAAAKTHFGKIAASGWHTCSMTMAMIVEHWKKEGIVSVGGAGMEELRWLRPVYPGDILRVEYTVLDKRQSKRRPEMGFVKSEIKTFNQNDEPVLMMRNDGMIAVRPTD